MGTTFANLRAQVRRNLGGRNDTTTDANILFHFNEVQKVLAKSHDFKEFQKTASPSLVVDQRSYTEAELSLTRLRKIYSMYVTHDSINDPVGEMSKVKWDFMVIPALPNVADGWPTRFMQWGGNLEFDRVPDSTFAMTIYYMQYPTSIVTEATDATDFDDIDGVLVALTTHLVFLTLEDEKMSNVWRGIASQQLKVHRIDENSVFNFMPSGRSFGSNPIDAQPWLDPFRRRT